MNHREVPSNPETATLPDLGGANKAPLLWPLLFWLLGLYLGKDCQVSGLVFPAIALGLCIAAIFLSRIRLWLLFLVCVLAGFYWISYQTPHQRVLFQMLNQRERISTNAEFEIRRKLAQNAYQLRLKDLSGAPFDLDLLLYHEGELLVGARYSAILDLSPIFKDPILDFFPSRFCARASIKYDLKLLQKRDVSSYVAQIRNWADSSLDANAGDFAPIAKALLLSDSSAKTLYSEPLKRGGMIHLIVVSGLHVWFIYAMLLLILNGFLPHRLAEGIILLVIMGFAALNYWAAPITRALIMIGTGIGARWLGRKVSSLQTLALSLFIITLFSPAQFFDLGLQLSFVSVGIIMLALPNISLWGWRKGHFSWWQNGLNSLANYLLLSLMVSVAILPLTLNKLGTGSLNGVIGNIFGIPLIAALLPLSFLILIFGPGGLIGEAFLSSYKFVCWLFERWMHLSASLPFWVENFWIGFWPAFGLVALLLPLYIWAKRKSRLSWRFVLPMWIFGLLLLLVPLVFGSQRSGIWIFNCGTADCALIILPTGEKILVDSGPGKNIWEAERDPSQSLDTDSWAGRKLIPWFKRNGIKEIDYLVLTHTHADHTGGFPALVNSVEIKNIVASDETQASDLWKLWKLQGWVAEHKITCVRDTFSLKLGASRLRFLHPDRLYSTENENNRSVVFRLDVKDKKILFTGDIESAAETWMLNRYPAEIDADYLKIPHHGSRSSSSSGFLNQVSPQEAWISVSKRNRFNFPHPETLKRLQTHCPNVKYTFDGTIFLEF